MPVFFPNNTVFPVWRVETPQSSTPVQELAKADLRRKRQERDASVKATNAFESMARSYIS
jgi:hypothetical protein